MLTSITESSLHLDKCLKSCSEKERSILMTCMNAAGEYKLKLLSLGKCKTLLHSETKFEALSVT